MNPTQKRHLIAILTMLSLLTLVFAAPKAVDAQSGTAAEMHQQINDLRAANGLAPLAVNSYLMQSAQNHANWIAAGNPGGHTGEDGSTAYDRALAVGYGEGAEIWVTENWARGYSLTVYDCIYVMWDDAAHMGNMLTTWHNEFGAGVALDVQGMTVYVVNFGHTSGVAPQPTATGPTATSGGPTSTPAGPTNTPVPFIQPVITSTPNPDGSVIHIVQFGQTLWGIVDAYGIEMADLLALNNLTEDSPIYENQELLIIPPQMEVEDTPDLTQTPATPTRTPSPTATRTRAITSTPQLLTPTPEPETGSEFFANIFSGDTMWVGIGLVAVSIFGIALLLFTSSRLK